MKNTLKWQTHFLVGLLAGAIIVAIDNFAFKGEVSPIVIVILLLASTMIVGAVWKWQAWISALTLWICVPLAHVVKHIMGLPDTLHPNTYTSILMLGGFTLGVTVLGLLFGVLIHGNQKSTPKPV